jgi:hypothetical protein
MIMVVFNDGSVSAEVAAWFETRGLTVRISDVDYSSEVRSSPWGRKAPSRNHHVWVDLLALDGRMIQGGFGSGQSADEAMLRARDRYRVEQGD